jgi:CHAD domain-containing protein
MIERELKMRAWPGFTLPDLDGVAPGAKTRRRETIDLDATYFDTEDLRLARSDMTLRHRRRGPRETWTLKLPSDAPGMQGGLSRHEVDERGSIDEVPPVLRLLVAAHVRSAPLQRVARLLTLRRRTVVEGSDERLLAELDDDEVSVMDGGRVAARFRELEVELAPGTPADVGEALVARLCRSGAEVSEPRPKVAEALGPRADEPPEVVVDPLPKHPTAGDAVTRAIRASVRRIIDHHPIAVLGDDPEGVHQMRVGARRLRSDLRTFRPLLDRSVTDPLRDELRELGNLLGAVRDPDVLGDRLRDGAARVLEGDARPSLEAVLARLDADRARAVERLFRGLATERYVTLLDALVAVALSPPLTGDADRPAADVLPGLVRKPWKQLRRLVADLPDDPPDEDLHEIRKRAKQVRYAAEAVAPALGKKARRAARAAESMQDVLGDHQDTVVAEQWLRASAAEPGTDAQTAFALGALAADERAQRVALRDEWPSRWRSASKPKRWRWLR